MYGKCGHLCSLVPRFLDMVVCDYCTRDAMRLDSGSDEVWVEIRKQESPVLRKLPKPRTKYGPEKTIPLFDVNSAGDADVPPF